MGGSLYTRPNTESVSVIRLYAKDFPGVNFSTMSANNIQDCLGVSGKIHYIRLIAVCFGGKSTQYASGAYAPAPTVLEFNYGGTSFSLAGQAIKPTRVRVPARNYVVGQYWGVTADGQVAPTIGAGVASQPLYTIEPAGSVDTSPVQYIDVALRY